MKEPAVKSNSRLDPGQRNMLLCAVGVFIAGMVMGWPTLRGDFLSGDDVHLVLNHVLVNHPSLEHAYRLATIVHRDLYQPVPMISFSMDFALLRLLNLTPYTTGPDAGAWLFHLTNVLFHAINGALVFWLIKRLSARASVGVAAALIFVLHPYAAEVVGWLNGRMMLLATLFSLASLIAVDHYLLKPRTWKALLTIAFVVLAMASKVRVGLPVLMLLIPLAHRVRPARSWWTVWVVSAVLTGAFTVFNIYTTSVSEMFQGASEQLQGSRIARTVIVLAWYFEHYLLPIGMSPWHPPDALVTWSHPAIPASLVWLVGVAGAVLISMRKTRVGLLGMVWFLATIASTLPLVPARDVLAADRYVYLPNVGLHWIVAALLVWAADALIRRTQSRAAPIAIAVLGVTCAAAILPYTWHVESYYVSNLAKAQCIAERYPNEIGVWEDIGWAHYRDDDFAAAIEGGRMELEHQPNETGCEALQLIGMAQVRIGRTEEGIATLHQAMQADPDYGKTYSRLGQVHYELEQYDDAERYLLQAIELMPDYLPTVEALGHLYRRMGRFDDATHWYQRALEINDFDPVATNALGEIEMQRGAYDQAMARFVRLLDWMPENTVARTNLGVCYANVGRVDHAEQAYTEALRRDPDAITACANLATLMFARGDPLAAMSALESTLASHPTERNLLVAALNAPADEKALIRAAGCWARAIEADAGGPDLLAGYAWTCTMARKWDLAIDAADRALVIHASEPLALAARVATGVARSDAVNADRFIELLLSPDVHGTMAIDRLARVLADIAAADPTNPWPYLFTARILVAQGRADDAVMGIKEFLNRCDEAVWRKKANAMLPVATRR